MCGFNRQDSMKERYYDFLLTRRDELSYLTKLVFKDYEAEHDAAGARKLQLISKQQGELLFGMNIAIQLIDVPKKRERVDHTYGKRLTFDSVKNHFVYQLNVLHQILAIPHCRFVRRVIEGRW